MAQGPGGLFSMFTIIYKIKPFDLGFYFRNQLPVTHGLEAGLY